MSDALEEHDGKVSISGRIITKLRFADYIDAIAQAEQELEAQEESLDSTTQGIRWRSVSKKNQTDDKQRQWHPERDKSKGAEAGYCNKLQVP